MRDLREFIAKLASTGDLKTVDTEVDANLEASALCSVSNKNGGPAIHCTKVKDYPEGFSLAGSLLGGPGSFYPHPERTEWSRICTAVGLDRDSRYEDIMTTLSHRVKEVIRPSLVSSGPCKDIIRLGDDANIMDLPVPFVHEDDAGRYATYSTTIVKDFDSDWTNWSTHRWMAAGPRTLHAGFLPDQHIGEIYAKYEKNNKAMPFCIVIGGPPAIALASAYKAPRGVSEVDIAGGFNLDPIELVKAETNDLYVPAQAEIIIEGEVLPSERAEEGPFTGFNKMTKQGPQPVFHIKAITHRENPIMPFIANGGKISDTMIIMSLMESIRLKKAYEHRSKPVRWVRIPVEFGLTLAIITPLPIYYGYVFQCARYVFSLSKEIDKVLVLNSEFDADDYVNYICEWLYKANPARDYHVIERTRLSPLVTYANEEEERIGEGARIYINSQWPMTWEKKDKPRRVSFESTWPVAIQEKILANWKSYGLPKEPKSFKL